MPPRLFIGLTICVIVVNASNDAGKNDGEDATCDLPNVSCGACLSSRGLSGGFIDVLHHGCQWLRHRDGSGFGNCGENTLWEETVAHVTMAGRWLRSWFPGGDTVVHKPTQDITRCPGYYTDSFIHGLDRLNGPPSETISPPVNPKGFALSFSGGGGRAALGASIALGVITNHNKHSLPSRGVSLISGLSGGSWGSAMYAVDITNDELDTFFRDQHELKWGSLVPFTTDPLSNIQSIVSTFLLSSSSEKESRRDVFDLWKQSLAHTILLNRLGDDITWSTVVDMAKAKGVTLQSFIGMKEAKNETPAFLIVGLPEDSDGMHLHRSVATASVDVPSASFDLDGQQREFSALNVLSLTSSAWTAVTGYMHATVGHAQWPKAEFELYDLGLSCNVPLSREWNENDREAAILFDYSHYEHNLGGLEACSAFWANHSMIINNGAKMDNGKKSGDMLPTPPGISGKSYVRYLQLDQWETPVYFVGFAGLTGSDIVQPKDMLIGLGTTLHWTKLGMPRQFSIADRTKMVCQYGAFVSQVAWPAICHHMGKDLSECTTGWEAPDATSCDYGVNLEAQENKKTQHDEH